MKFVYYIGCYMEDNKNVYTRKTLKEGRENTILFLSIKLLFICQTRGHQGKTLEFFKNFLMQKV